MTEIDFRRPDGKLARGFLAEPPEDRDTKNAVLLVHDIWGLSTLNQNVAKRFAQAGYRTLIPDMFSGRVAGSLEEGLALMNELDFADAAQQTVQGGGRWLRERSQAVAVAGFCVGGAIALLAARVPGGFDAALSFYGIPPVEAGDPASIRIPVSCHFGDQDEFYTPTLVNALEERFRAGSVPYELFRYQAGHAFMHPEWHLYDPAAAELAWSRGFEFLARVLVK